MQFLLWILVTAAMDEPSTSSTVVIIDATDDALGRELSAAALPRGASIALRPIQAARDASPNVEEATRAVVSALDAARVARRLALELREAAALAKFEEALAFFERGITVLDDYSDFASVFLDMGALLVDMGREAQALQSFRQVLLLAPKRRPDKHLYHPQVIEQFARVEAERRRLSRGSLSVTSQPPGAEIWLDGAPRGVTPASFDALSLGEHWLVVRLGGHASFASRVTVARDHVERVEVFLRGLDEVAAIAGSTIASLRSRGTGDDLAPLAERVSARSLLVVAVAGGGLRGGMWREGEGTRWLAAPTADALIAKAFEAPPPSQSPIVANAPAVTRRGAHPAVAWLPLGIGQFAARRPVAGTLFLVSELALLGTNIAAYWLLQGQKLPNTDPALFADGARAEALKWTANSALIGLGVVVIVGAIEGILRRSSAP